MNTNATREIPADGSPLAYTAGAHTVHLQRTIENGFTLYVTAGPARIDELTDTFTDEDMARTAARRICVRLNAGDIVWALVAEKQTAERDLIQAVNSTMDQAEANYLTPRQAARNIGAFAVPARVNTRRLRTLSDAMRRALAHADEHGVIEVQPGVRPSTLAALHIGGLGDTEGDERPHQVSRLRLNPAGRRMADEQKEQVA